MLLDRGIHPLRIAEGYERACKVSIENLQNIAHSFNFSESDMEPLVQTCMTTLSSKMCVISVFICSNLACGTQSDVDVIKPNTSSFTAN